MIVAGILGGMGSFAEDGVLLLFQPGERFVLTERQDLRMRENNRYLGLISREFRLSLGEVSREGGNILYRGTSYLLQEMKRDDILLGRRLENSASCELSLSPNGEYRLPQDQLFPLLRHVPRFPDKPIKRGDTWRVYGERMVKAREGSRYTPVPIYIEYRYDGERGNGSDVYHAVFAQYALRYRGENPSGDPSLEQVSGSHRVNIHIPLESPSRIFMRDLMEEQYILRGGTEITYSGVILTWFDAPANYDRQGVIRRVTEESKRQLDEDGPEGGVIEISEGEEGLVLSLPDLHFFPDSPKLLPREEARLDLIADTLAEIEGVTFLIRGHTADVGSPESQRDLSFQRAKTILNELTTREIPPSRMLYEGRGGTQPIAPNDTEEGRRQNRRVEIIILE